MDEVVHVREKRKSCAAVKIGLWEKESWLERRNCPAAKVDGWKREDEWKRQNVSGAASQIK